MNDEGTLFSCFWALTALATVVYYRRIVLRSAADLLLVGVLPLAAAGVLAWVVVRSFPSLSPTSHWTLLGVGVAGLVLMAVSAFLVRAPYFGLARESWTPVSRAEPGAGPPSTPSTPAARDGIPASTLPGAHSASSQARFAWWRPSRSS